MKFGVVVFPGSNCDDDMVHVLGTVLGQEVEKIWHKNPDLPGFGSGDCIVLPGGFSFGDYLRSGAIASLSPVMKSVIEFANNGGYVIGICNGFQILCESGLLPGVLMKNDIQKFVCKNVFLKTGSQNTAMTADLDANRAYQIPIAHADGRYFISDADYAKLIDNDQVLFRYCDAAGNTSSESNPNGSRDNIAGVCNVGRNVFGMMPHPERASEEALNNTDGVHFFKSLIARAEAGSLV